MNTQHAVKKRITSVWIMLSLSCGMYAQAPQEQEFTAVVGFDLFSQPEELSGSGYEIAASPNSISAALLPALPPGAIITSTELFFPSLTTTEKSFGSDVVFGFTGSVSAEYTFGDHAPESAGTFDFYSAYENATVDPEGGSVFLHYYDLVDDNPEAETVFPTGHDVAWLTIRYVVRQVAAKLTRDLVGADDEDQDEYRGMLRACSPELYPNPTDRAVFADMLPDQQGTFEVYDLQGKRVLSGILNQHTVIDLGDHESGMYVVRMITGNSLHAQKVVKR